LRTGNLCVISTSTTLTASGRIAIYIECIHGGATGANTNYVEANSVFIKLLGVIAVPTYAADVIA
jgi:hypothetical protein